MKNPYKNRGEFEMVVEAAKKLVRMGRRETLFRLPGDKLGEWRTVKAPFTADVKKFIVGKYGDEVVIANEDFLRAASSSGFVPVDNRFSAN